MSDKFKISSIRVNLCTILFILFLVLKLTGNIDWSWWWVTAPLWVPASLFLIVLAILVLILGIMSSTSSEGHSQRKVVK